MTLWIVALATTNTALLAYTIRQALTTRRCDEVAPWINEPANVMGFRSWDA